MVKGITHPDDARRALDIGATKIGVSNHGGNNLDTTPASVRFLRGIVDAVAGRAQISIDGEMRRGADVVKALALGTDVALVGRPWFFGLGADGERGVTEVIDSYRLSIDRTLIGLGKSSIKELNPEDVIVPEGFFVEARDNLPMAAR